MSTQKKPFMITDIVSGDMMQEAGMYEPDKDMVAVPTAIKGDPKPTWKNLFDLNRSDFDIIDQYFAYQRLQKIDNVDQDLTWYSKSYDAGDKDCKCSACSLPIKGPEEFDDPMSKEAEDHMPIRIWRGLEGAREEATMHQSCGRFLIRANKLLSKGTHNTVNKPIKLK